MVLGVRREDVTVWRVWESVDGDDCRIAADRAGSPRIICPSLCMGTKSLLGGGNGFFRLYEMRLRTVRGGDRGGGELH